MSVRSSLISLSAAVALVVVASPVHAQGSAPAAADTVHTPWPAKPVGTYDLQIGIQDRDVAATLVISDSAQSVVAVLTQNDSGEGHSVSVAIKGGDMTLVGDTPNGALTLTLMQRDGKITGKWSFGGDITGTLTGVKRAAK